MLLMLPQPKSRATVSKSCWDASRSPACSLPRNRSLPAGEALCGRPLHLSKHSFRRSGGTARHGPGAESDQLRPNKATRTPNWPGALYCGVRIDLASREVIRFSCSPLILLIVPHPREALRCRTRPTFRRDTRGRKAPARSQLLPPPPGRRSVLAKSVSAKRRPFDASCGMQAE
jgi:hypothetical protein